MHVMIIISGGCYHNNAPGICIIYDVLSDMRESKSSPTAIYDIRAFVDEVFDAVITVNNAAKTGRIDTVFGGHQPAIIAGEGHTLQIYWGANPLPFCLKA